MSFAQLQRGVSRKWPFPNHQHFEFLIFERDLKSSIQVGGTQLTWMLKNEHRQIWDVPNFPPRSVEDVCCPSGDKPTDELRVWCPGVCFSFLFSEYKKRNKSNKLKRSFLTLQCLYVLVTMISKIGDLEVEENNTKISWIYKLRIVGLCFLWSSQPTSAEVRRLKWCDWAVSFRSSRRSSVGVWMLRQVKRQQLRFGASGLG